MIGANHPFQVRGLNVLDENGNEGCAHCGRPRYVHPAAAAALVAAAKSYDHQRRPNSRKWTQVPDNQAARLIEGALLTFKRQLLEDK